MGGFLQRGLLVLFFNASLLVVAVQLPKLPRVTPGPSSLAPPHPVKRDDTITSVWGGVNTFTTITDLAQYSSIIASSAFIGFTIEANITSATYCTGSSQWTVHTAQGTRYGACCKALNPCPMYVGCTDGGILSAFETSLQFCGTDYECKTISIYDVPEGSSVSGVGIVQCWPRAFNGAYTRDIEITSSSSSSSSPTTTPSTPSSTPAAGATSPAPTPSTTSTPPSDPPSSKVWIAGPILGAVLGLVVIAGLIALLRRRKRKRETQQSMVDQPNLHHPPSTQGDMHSNRKSWTAYAQDTQGSWNNGGRDARGSWHHGASSPQRYADARAPPVELANEREIR